MSVSNHEIFVPLTFGVDDKKMFSVIPYPFQLLLKNKFSEDLYEFILGKALTQATKIMQEVIENKNYHHEYVANNKTLVKRGYALHKFANNTTNAAGKAESILLSTYRLMKRDEAIRFLNVASNNIQKNYPSFTTGMWVNYENYKKSRKRKRNAI